MLLFNWIGLWFGSKTMGAASPTLLFWPILWKLLRRQLYRYSCIIVLILVLPIYSETRCVTGGRKSGRAKFQPRTLNFLSVRKNWSKITRHNKGIISQWPNSSLCQQTSLSPSSTLRFAHSKMEEHLIPSQIIATNKNGGIYSRGRAYGTNNKSDVLTAYYASILTHKPHTTTV